MGDPYISEALEACAQIEETSADYLDGLLATLKAIDKKEKGV